MTMKKRLQILEPMKKIPPLYPTLNLEFEEDDKDSSNLDLNVLVGHVSNYITTITPRPDPLTTSPPLPASQASTPNSALVFNTRKAQYGSRNRTYIPDPVTALSLPTPEDEKPALSTISLQQSINNLTWNICYYTLRQRSVTHLKSHPVNQKYRKTYKEFKLAYKNMAQTLDDVEAKLGRAVGLCFNYKGLAEKSEFYLLTRKVVMALGDYSVVWEAREERERMVVERMKEDWLKVKELFMGDEELLEVIEKEVDEELELEEVEGLAGRTYVRAVDPKSGKLLWAWQNPNLKEK
jgi:hypothetical protein